VFGVLAALLLLGVRTLVLSVTNARLARPAAAPAATDTSGFPTLAAEAFAAQFGQAYETYDSANVQAHQQAVAAYLPEGSDPTVGWDGQGKQIAAVGVPSGITVLDQRRAVVVVAVQVGPFRDGREQTPRWVYLAVPIVADRGALAVSGKPSIVAPPALASVQPVTQAVGSEDTDLESSLKQTLPAFLKAYASSSQAELQVYAAPGVTLRGLGGQVELSELTGVVVPQGGPDQRTALITVRWADRASGASFTQDYRLRLTQVAGQWHVSAVEPAVG
jgi:hypothetical protein